MKARLVIHPGWVYSQTDGDRHYITSSRLIKLYRLNPKDVVINCYYGLHPRANQDIHFFPLYNGDYEATRALKMKEIEVIELRKDLTMKLYVTFGQVHRHVIDGIVFDKDCVAVIECNNEEHGRCIAFSKLDDKWCFTKPDSIWEEKCMKFYPRGYITLKDEYINKDNEDEQKDT